MSGAGGGWNGLGMSGAGGGWNGLGMSGGGWNGLGMSGGGWNGLGKSGGGWNGFGGKKKSVFVSCFWMVSSLDFSEGLMVFGSVFWFPGIIGEPPGRFGKGGSFGKGGKGGRFGNGGSWGSPGRGGRPPSLGVAGSWSGGGNVKSGMFECEENFLLGSVMGFLEFWMLGFWLQSIGCFNGLKVKNPAEKMCVPCFLDLRWSEDEVAVEATEQYGSLLLMRFTVHPSIFLMCLLTEKGKWTLNSPCLFVFTSSLKTGFEVLPYLHSTATDAPKNRTIRNFSVINLTENPIFYFFSMFWFKLKKNLKWTWNEVAGFIKILLETCITIDCANYNCRRKLFSLWKMTKCENDSEYC